MAVLDRVLEDRRVTPSEARQLLDFASGIGMTQQQMRKAHRLYLRELIQVAIEHDVTGNLGAADLHNVRVLLNLTQADYDAAMEEARRSAGGPLVGIGTQDLAGRSVCFTGSLQGRRAGEAISRGEAEALARAHGMDVRPRVTRELDYLVAADPDTMSGKAKKARSYGIPILAEARFWQLLGIQVD